MPQALISCPNCGSLQNRLDPGPGGRVDCGLCATHLYRRGRLSLEQWLAIGWTCLVVFAIAQFFPVVTLTLAGRELNASFWQALYICWERGQYGVSVIAGLAGFWLPLLQITLTIWVMQSLAARRMPPDLALVLRFLRAISPWSMATVLILGIIVAIVKMADMVMMRPGPGIFGFLILSYLLTGLGRWNARALWHWAEDAAMVAKSGAHGSGVVCEACYMVQGPSHSGRCVRCNARLAHDKHPHDATVWALLIAAVIFYLPANMLPMMRVQSVAGASEHTILGGVIELWQLGSWDLALIVFVASVLVPLTKIFALAFLLLAKRPRGIMVQRRRTRLYTAVEFVGQWSMLDVFVVVLMAAMANFQGLAQIDAGPAALNFGAVVFLTMLAAHHFDPQPGWRALANRPELERQHP